MMRSVRGAVAEVDLILLIVDVSAAFGRGDAFTLELLSPVSTKKFVLLNKIDRVQKSTLLPIIERYSKSSFEEIIPISALTGENVENLLAQIFKHMPEGQMFYPPDQISDQQERTIAAEIIREKLILLTEEELPYSTAVVIDRFEESDHLFGRLNRVLAEFSDFQRVDVINSEVICPLLELCRIDVVFFRQISETRLIFLDLHVKVKKHWRDDEETLRTLGLGEN